MSVEQMRQWLMDHPKYKSPTWYRKVRAMQPNQVIAVYYRLVNAQK